MYTVLSSMTIHGGDCIFTVVAVCVSQALRQQKHLLQRQLEDLKEHYQQLVDEQDERVSPHSLLQRGVYTVLG